MAAGRSKFVFKKSKGKVYWQLVVRGKPVAQSLNGYADVRRARLAVEGLKNHVASATVSEEENGSSSAKPKKKA